MVERLVIRFFTDNNVPESVPLFLERVGHEVTRLRDVMPTETEDPVIEVACSRSGQVLVTHDKDFRTATKRLGISRREYAHKLHRIQLRCEEPRSASRIEDTMSLIEHEWLLIRPDRPMIIEVLDEIIRIVR
jgi:predicted nuclease of predicted toxin-antitoxin system